MNGPVRTPHVAEPKSDDQANTPLELGINADEQNPPNEIAHQDLRPSDQASAHAVPQEDNDAGSPMAHPASEQSNESEIAEAKPPIPVHRSSGLLSRMRLIRIRDGLDITIEAGGDVARHRLRERVSVGVCLGVSIKTGSVLMLCLGAANRDPRKVEDPNEFRLERKNVREHIALGRGIHTCAGAPLARVERRVTVNRLLDRTREITRRIRVRSSLMWRSRIV